jgi:D-lyxose ketol-isomerase
MINLNDVVEFLHNPLAYEQKLVSKINTKGEQILLSSFSELYSDEPSTIKIEGMEKFNKAVWSMCQYYATEYNHIGPVTCHAFLAHVNSPSFGSHIDPDDVVILCIDGVKSLEVNGRLVELHPGEEIHIKSGTLHKALNTKASLMLSFGLEKFLIEKAKDYELDVLPKND